MPATPLTERPLLEGWVLKQSKHVKVFRHRWLVLTPTRLLSYRHKRAYAEAGGAVPTETFEVDMLQLVRPVDEDNCSSLIIHTSDGDGTAETRLLMLAFVGSGGGAAAAASSSTSSSSLPPALEALLHDGPSVLGALCWRPCTSRAWSGCSALLARPSRGGHPLPSPPPPPPPSALARSTSPRGRSGRPTPPRPRTVVAWRSLSCRKPRHRIKASPASDALRPPPPVLLPTS